MASTTPRRSTRLPHMHTPKMSERKKSLFQSELHESRESLTKHRRLPVVDSESDSEECDLGIISTIDSSSDENDPSTPKTPERQWHGTRSQTKKLFRETEDLKHFIKSPFTLKKYQARYSCPDSKCTGSLSTPATPHLQNHPGTPSSTHSCTSIHTTSSTSSRARKSLASLIADTESCSSSLKDLNFDSDSGADSKENTPTKVRRSTRKQKLTPKFQSFKGVLMEQKKNVSPMKTAVVCLTKMDMSSIISPTQMLKTPHNMSEANVSPPKLNRRNVEIQESPESNCDSEKSYKRLHYDSMSEGPSSKHPRLDSSTAPKARLSLFNSDKLREILSAKSFYGKSNPEINSTVAAKISSAIEATSSHKRRLFSHTNSNRRKRRPGQINMGVKHRIRKPKINKKMYKVMDTSIVNKTNNSTMSASMNDTSMLSQNSSQELGLDKTDPFDKEKQTIEALLSQWTEEEVPESELSFSKPRSELPCFNSTVIEETSQIFQPIGAVPVVVSNIPHDNEAVIVELGAKIPEKITTVSQNVTGLETSIPESVSETLVHDDVLMTDSDGHRASHGEVPKDGQFLPVEGGFIFVEDPKESAQEDLPDLDEIERELKMLDEQILKMAQSNNIDPEVVLASTESAISTINTDAPSTSETSEPDKPKKLFAIFNKGNSGHTTPSSKGQSEKISRKPLLRSTANQYVIDAGQKKFGAVQCSECGVIYQIGDPQDEHDHLVHHNSIDVLKFNSLKDECIVGRSASGRCVRIRGGENGWKRVETLLARVVHPQLGYGINLPRDDHVSYTAYLYIEKKLIIGCLIVEPKTKAFKLLPGNPDCCSTEEYRVKCGISRIWTHRNYRRRGVAARLLDCARASFLYGTALRTDEVAFSAPTASGKALATKYCGTENFYVYID